MHVSLSSTTPALRNPSTLHPDSWTLIPHVPARFEDCVFSGVCGLTLPESKSSGTQLVLLDCQMHGARVGEVCVYVVVGYCQIHGARVGEVCVYVVVGYCQMHGARVGEVGVYVLGGYMRWVGQVYDAWCVGVGHACAKGVCKQGGPLGRCVCGGGCAR